MTSEAKPLVTFIARDDSVTPTIQQGSVPNNSLAFGSGSWAPNCSLAVSDGQRRSELISNDELTQQTNSIALYEAFANPQQEELVRAAFDAVKRSATTGSEEETAAATASEVAYYRHVLLLLHADDARRFHSLHDGTAALTLEQFSSFVNHVAVSKTGAN